VAKRRRKRKSRAGKRLIWLLAIGLVIAGFMTRRMIFQNAPGVLPARSGLEQSVPRVEPPAPPAKPPQIAQQPATTPLSSNVLPARPARAGSDAHSEHLTDEERRVLDKILQEKSK
jgi:hypothetical protein